jgi:large subunit ribosomal protein L21
MYAVIKAGGKQQRVSPGDVIEVELMHADGDTVELHPILVVDDEGKTHYGKEAQRAVVVAKLVGEQKGDKVKVFKYRPKSGYARRQGHRQLMTLLEIQDIKLRTRAPRKKADEEQSVEAEQPADAE